MVLNPSRFLTFFSDISPKIGKYLAQRSALFSALLLLLCALLLRGMLFNDPLICEDEDWYLYVGGQLWHGILPYSGIWDRKPFGLFALYAPFALFGSWRFLAYQLGATLSVWITALILWRTARLFTPQTSAFFAALLYIALLNCFGGYGGQAPVFYNLLTACAFGLFFRLFPAFSTAPALLKQTGIVALFLIGIALEIKPTVLFEGLYLGCLFLCWNFKIFQNQHVENHVFIVKNALLWISAALLPTLLIAGYYTAFGHGQDWFFANILSIFKKHPQEIELQNPLQILAITLIACALWGFSFIPLRQQKSKKRTALLVLGGWLCVAALAMFLLPPYSPIYSLPFCLPFAFLCAFAGERALKGKILLAILLSVALIKGIGAEQKILKKIPPEIYPQVRAVLAQKPDCLFLYGGIEIQDILPQTATCQLTKWQFVYSLADKDEQGALGVNEFAEVKHILAQKPHWIMSTFLAENAENLSQELPQTVLLAQILRREYRLKGQWQGATGLFLYESRPRFSESAPTLAKSRNS